MSLKNNVAKEQARAVSKGGWWRGGDTPSSQTLSARLCPSENEEGGGRKGIERERRKKRKKKKGNKGGRTGRKRRSRKKKNGIKKKKNTVKK